MFTSLCTLGQSNILWNTVRIPSSGILQLAIHGDKRILFPGFTQMYSMQACHDFSSNEKTKAKTDENVNHDCKGLRSLGIKHVRISRITEFLKLEYCQLSPNEKCQPHQTDHLVFTLGPPSKLLIKFVCLGWKQFETGSSLFPSL